MSRNSRVRDRGYISSHVSIPAATYNNLEIAGGQETVTVGGYKYVVFTSSGTLTVTNSGTVALCTIGGGGGAGKDTGGGGGGGELDLFANFTVSSNLTITIGAGGVGNTDGVARGTNGITSTVVEGVTTHQSALGGGGGASAGGAVAGAAGGSGGGGDGNSATAGGGASGSNTFAGGAGVNSAVDYGGGGGGATAVGSSSVGTGGQGYALSSIDANLTAANFPTTLTGITHVSSGGGAGQTGGSGFPAGGTNAGTGGRSTTNPTNATGYGCGGGGGTVTQNATNGFQGLVIIRVAI